MLSKQLNNGVEIPMLGFGTYRLLDQEAYDIVTEAIKVGYRHFDTATVYNNEAEVGQAILDSGIERESFFVTTKLYNDDQLGHDHIIQTFEKSLDLLQMDYVDLYLIHWPLPVSKESWKALEEIYKSGRARAIGVSNFEIEHLKLIEAIATVQPMVNQFERHPYLQQNELHDYCSKQGIVCEAWMPIARGEANNEPQLIEISKKYNKTVPQILLRWQIQSGYVVFPKTKTVSRVKENFDIFDFELDATEMEIINELDSQTRYGTDPRKYNFVE